MFGQILLPRSTFLRSRNLVAVHRLREVSCLYGFTRFEAAPTGTDGDVEDIQLSFRGAPSPGRLLVAGD
jgi:hypothetical protein